MRLKKKSWTKKNKLEQKKKKKRKENQWELIGSSLKCLKSSFAFFLAFI